MTVSVTWWKKPIDPMLRFGLVPLVTALAVAGCGTDDAAELITSVPPAAEPELAVEPSSEPQDPPQIGLRPLPTPAEVIAAAPGGRPDPFQPLPLVAATGLASVDGEAMPAVNPSNALVLTGVIAVGEDPRALVRLQNSTSVLCLGSGGRCDGEVDALLPEGWSVVAIDLEAGCVQLSLDDDVQDPVCML